MAVAHIQFEIRPHPLTNLTVTRVYGGTTETVTAQELPMADYYTVTSYEGTFTISADGYETQTVEQTEYSTNNITLVEALPDNIADAITAAQGRVADCYTAISNKGGTLPATQNLANMPTAIGSIPTGSTINNQDITITQNGTYTADEGYTGLGTVTVNVNKSKFGITIDDLIGDLVSGKYTVKTTPIDVSFDGLTSFQKLGGAASDGTRVMSHIFSNSMCIRSVTFPDLYRITSAPSQALEYFCYNSYSIQSVSFPILDMVTVDATFGYAFENCQKLSSISFSSLRELNGLYIFDRAFKSCSVLRTLSFPSLTLINRNCFRNAFESSGIQTVAFNSVTSLGQSYGDCFQYAFKGCKDLQSISFASLKTDSFGTTTTQFSNMFDSSTAQTSGEVVVHFPSNLETTIQGLTGYPLFGGTSDRITLSFDLEATE